MKNIFSTFKLLIFVGALITTTSCVDFMSTETNRLMLTDDNLINSPNDTAYSVVGILAKVQKLSDKYVLLGELRGDLLDVSDKSVTIRSATAKSSIIVNETIHSQISEGTNKKGDVFAVAQVAAIMAAKNTSTIIPMCHPIPLTGVDVQFEWLINDITPHYEVIIHAEVKTKGVTGVEMEALTAASAAALTIYDMCKAAGKEMIIGPTMLLKKSGGINGDYERTDT